MSPYPRPFAPRDALRLHLNEHTGGCSPRVLQRLRELDATKAAFYPDYNEVTAAAASWFGLREDQLILTNGLDEGLLGATILALRSRGGEGLIVEPAFDMYEVCLRALGGEVVRVSLNADFSLDVDRLIAAVTPRTRVIFVNDPHNPTGTRVPLDAFERMAASAPHALLFIDEAYAEFAGETFAGAAVASSNILVGRTFAKAYGLAGLRLGAVLGPTSLIDALKDIVPPYSVNAYAAAALVEALEDRAYIDDYIAQASRSRELIYEACRELSIEAFESEANFVLVRVGTAAAEVTEALAARGIIVRDRSADPVCAGCIRLTAGRVEDTRAALVALREVL